MSFISDDISMKGFQENSKEYGKAGSLAIKIEPYANGPLFTEITVFQRILTPQKLDSWMNKKSPLN